MNSYAESAPANASGAGVSTPTTAGRVPVVVTTSTFLARYTDIKARLPFGNPEAFFTLNVPAQTTPGK